MESAKADFVNLDRDFTGIIHEQSTRRMSRFPLGGARLAYMNDPGSVPRSNYVAPGPRIDSPFPRREGAPRGYPGVRSGKKEETPVTPPPNSRTMPSRCSQRSGP